MSNINSIFDRITALNSIPTLDELEYVWSPLDDSDLEFKTFHWLFARRNPRIASRKYMHLLFSASGFIRCEL